MKCINKTTITNTISMLLSLTLVACANNTDITNLVASYDHNELTISTFANDLVIPEDKITLDGFEDDENIMASALFDLSSGEILQSKNLYEPISPASTTKILTAYVAMKLGDLDDIVTISDNAVNLPAGSSVSGISAGDTLTLRDLIYALTLQSGNDSAIAISEHISGSESAFVGQMNSFAHTLGATDTTFKNSHGLDADGHQTTVYDLYLMFNAIIKDPAFIEVIATTNYTTIVKDAQGVERSIEWIPTNYYHRGLVKSPDNITVIGGKTGTTSKAKNCLVLLVEDMDENQYVTITMGSSTKDGLYENLNEMFELLPIN